MSDRVRTVDPVEDQGWSYLASTHGSLFSSPPWIGALRDTYDLEIEGWIADDEKGSIRGGMPVARLGDGPWRRLSTLPFSDYCNAIDLDGSAWPRLAELLVEGDVPVELRHLGEGDLIGDERFDPVDPPDSWHSITLDRDEDRAWAALSGSARRAIRKALDSKVEIRVSNDLTSLRSFYELHLGTRKHKYRLLAQPWDFFINLHKRFGDEVILLGAWEHKTLVAGILLLVWADVAYYKFNASSPDALGVRPNDLLMWEATRLGVSRGLTTLDLGRTDADHESLARYKAKYATTTEPIHSLRRGRFERDPAVADLLGPMTEILTRPEVPDHITEEAANRVYHHFA